MKIRNGFISNSSTTSFCLMGDSINDSWDTRDEIYEKLKAVDKNFAIYGRDDYCYFGMPFDHMKEDETKAQFRDRVSKLMEQALGKKFDVRILCNGWYDG